MIGGEYIEARNGGYYIAGTRIGLDIVIHEFRGGASPDSILESFPSIGSLGKVYGAIAFALEHPVEVDAYLAQEQQRFEALKAQNPLPADMLDRFLRAKRERSTR